MFLWLMYKKVMCCSYRDLESITGIDYSTFIKFRKRLMEKEWFVSVFERFSTRLMAHFRKVLLLADSSFVETFSKHEEDGSAYSGYKEKEGFKFHALLDFYSRLPLGAHVTDGAVHDTPAGEVLIRGAPRTLPVTGFAADKGYDSESFVCEIHRKWKKAKIGIPMRRMMHDGNDRNRKERGAYRTRDPALYRKRTEIERYFSRKKHVFRLGPNRAVPRTLDGDSDDAASSPPQPHPRPLDAFFETLVESLEKNPDAFTPTTANVSTHVNDLK